MRELSLNEMNTVAGGFSIGSCSISGSFHTSRDRHGGSSTSVSVNAKCGLNVPDSKSANHDGGKNSKSGKNNRGSHQPSGGRNH